MPIEINGKKMEFSSAVKHVMNKKGLSKERASAYVATVERKQKGKLEASMKLASLKLATLRI